MKIEKIEKNYCFGDIQVGECFTTASGRLFIKANIGSEDKYGGFLDGAIDLKNGEPTYFADGASVFPVLAKIVIEEKEISNAETY